MYEGKLWEVVYEEVGSYLTFTKHKGVRHNCDYDGCSFYADTKKQLKEHRKKHSDDHQHICTQCGKGFKYRSGLKRHRDSNH